MTPLTTDRLAELRQTAEAATQGEWYIGPTPRFLAQGQIHEWGGQTHYPVTIRSTEHTEELATTWTYLLPSDANAAHIAAFDPPTVLALLDALAEAQQRAENAERGLHDAYSDIETLKEGPDACSNYSTCGCSHGDDGHCQYCIMPREQHHDRVRLDVAEAERDRLAAQVEAMREVVDEMRENERVALLHNRLAQEQVSAMREAAQRWDNDQSEWLIDEAGGEVIVYCGACENRKERGHAKGCPRMALRAALAALKETP